MGCFPLYAKISVPGGKVPIGEIHVGDLITRPEGRKEFANATVRDIYESEEELISLVTTHSAILTTADQLFRCYDGKDRRTQELMSQFIGYLLDDKEIVYVKVVAIIPKNQKAKVRHLHVDEPNLYLADGFLVHNKGGGGSSSTTSEAPITPELRPLFSQTGKTLQSLQTFRPGTFTGWTPYTGVGGVPYTAGRPGWGYPPGIFNFGFGGQPGMPGMEQPSFPTPISSPTQPPTIDMQQTAPGVFAPAPTTAPASNASFARLQEIERLQTRPTGEMGFDTMDPKEVPLYNEYQELRKQLGLAPLTPTGTPGPDQNRFAPFTPTTTFPGGGGTSPLTPPTAPGFPGGEGGLPLYPGPEGGGTPPFPGSVLDEFLFANPQFIPQASPGQLAILGRQQQRAFGPQITGQELFAQGGFLGAGQMRPGEEFATGLSSTFPFLRPEEMGAIGVGGRFGQLYGPEVSGLNAAGRFGQFYSPEMTGLTGAEGLGRLRLPEFAALSTAGRAGQITPEELAALGYSRGFGRLRGPEIGALGTAGGLGEIRDPEQYAFNRATQFGGLTTPEQMALEQVQQFTGGEIGQGPATQAAMRAVREPIVNELTMAGLGRSGAVADELGKAYAPILAQELATRAAVIPQLAGIGQQQRGGEIAGAQVAQRLGEAQRAGDTSAVQAYQRAGEALRQGDVAAAQNFMRAGDAQRQGGLSGAQIESSIGQAQRAGDTSAVQAFMGAGEALRRGDQAGAQMFMAAGQAQRSGDIAQAGNLMNIAQAARNGSVQAAQIQSQIAQAMRTGDLAGAQQLAQLGNQLVQRESTLLGEAATSEEANRELAAMQFQSFQQDMLRRQQLAQSLTTGVLGGFPTVTGSTTVSRTRGGGAGVMGK